MIIILTIAHPPLPYWSSPPRRGLVQGDLPQELIDRAILAFRKILNACVKVKGSHFEHFIITK
jgi:hypothetical protein